MGWYQFYVVNLILSGITILKIVIRHKNTITMYLFRMAERSTL